jgi:hypothetical protein
VHLLATAPATGGRCIHSPITKVAERREPTSGYDHYLATASAIATIRPALRHEALSPKRNRAVTTTTGDHIYGHTVNHEAGSKDLLWMILVPVW